MGINTCSEPGGAPCLQCRGPPGSRPLCTVPSLGHNKDKKVIFKPCIHNCVDSIIVYSADGTWRWSSNCMTCSCWNCSSAGNWQNESEHSWSDNTSATVQSALLGSSMMVLHASLVPGWCAHQKQHLRSLNGLQEGGSTYNFPGSLWIQSW